MAEELNEEKSGDKNENINVSVETVNYSEFKATLSKHFDELSKLIRLYKAKDDTISKLSDEVVKYRGGFVQQLVKPLCVSLISFREDCAKTYRNVESYAKNAESVARYSEYLLSDMEEVMSTHGLTVEDDVVLLNGVKLSDCVCRKGEKEKNPEKIAENPDEQVDGGVQGGEGGFAKESYSFDTLLHEVEYGRIRIEKLLTDSNRDAENLLSYVNLASSIEENYSDAILLPLYREIENLYEKLKDGVEEIKKTVTEDNKIQCYSSALAIIIDGIYKILVHAGVLVETDIGDEYDIKTNKIVKIVQTDDINLDKKVAVRHTDCYSFEGKLIYPSKVDVYKYVPSKD